MLAMRIFVTLQQGEDGYIVADCPMIPGCMSQGRTETEALENIREAIVGCLEVRAEMGLPPTVEIRELEIAV